MKVQVIKTRIFQQGESILSFVDDYVGPIVEETIIVVTSKIVALAENRVIEIIDEFTKEKIIKQESSFAMKTKWTWLTINDGMLMASAGVDESNANGKIILLPKDSFVQANNIRQYFCEKYGVKKLGVIITDSRCLPLRAGVVGVSLGYAGFNGFKEYVGELDIFGRKLLMTHVDMPDSLAAAAVVCMGEGNEQQPLAVISDIKLDWCDLVNQAELKIEPANDMFRPLFENLPGLKL